MEFGKTYVLDVSKSTIDALKIVAIIFLILLLTSVVKAMVPGIKIGKCNGDCAKKQAAATQQKPAEEKKEKREPSDEAREKKYWQNLVADKNIKIKKKPEKIAPVVRQKDQENKPAEKKPVEKKMKPKKNDKKGGNKNTDKKDDNKGKDK